MSFSFTAAGTKAETLAGLAQARLTHDPAAISIIDLLTAMVGAGPAASSDEKPVLYVWGSRTRPPFLTSASMRPARIR
jgi:hypothetical protein